MARLKYLIMGHGAGLECYYGGFGEMTMMFVGKRIIGR